MDDKRLENYTVSNLSEFRKSIAKMGTTVANGNVILDPSKRRRDPKLNIEDIVKTPYNDKNAWRIYSRLFYSDSLYTQVRRNEITPTINDTTISIPCVIVDYTKYYWAKVTYTWIAIAE